RAMGDRAAEANALQNLGSAYQMMGHPEQASEDFQRALEIFESIGRRTDQATVLTRMGALQSETGGHRSEAIERFTRARAISQQSGDRRTEVIATLGLGRETLAAGKPAEALKLASEALQVAESEGYRPEQEGILVLMARAEMAQGALNPARERMEAALE